MKEKIFTFKNVALGTLIIFSFAVIIFAKPHQAHAQAACLNTIFGSTGTAAGTNAMAVATHDDTTQGNTGSQKTATCILNSLAKLLIRQLLQHMTQDIVNWINSGFSGNPAFLTNPEGFFQDIADQATGQFLAGAGPLQALCSPFGLDLRLNLALNQAYTLRQRYTCTLSKIIQNVGNGPRGRITVGSSAGGSTLGGLASGADLSNSNALSVNGWSINGFTNNFGQGGWPAFISMTTEPQNNPYGAWLMAQSDLKQGIATKQDAVNNDLNRGNGFLSWQKCTNVPSSETATDPKLGLSQNQYDRLTSNGSVSNGANSSIKINYDKTTGNSTLQRCSVETPGSFISGSLLKQTGASVDSVVNIQDINSAIDQIAGALLGQILQHGLADISSITSGGSGGNGSRTDSIINQLTAQQDQNSLAAYNRVTLAGLDNSIAAIKSYISTREQAVAVLTAAQNTYTDARACFTIKGDQTNIAAIDAKVVPLVSEITLYQAKLNTASDAVHMHDLLTLEAAINNAQSTADIDRLAGQFRTLAGQVTISSTDTLDAQTNLSKASTDAGIYSTNATQYQNLCNGVITSISTSTTPTAP